MRVVVRQWFYCTTRRPGSHGLVEGAIGRGRTTITWMTDMDEDWDYNMCEKGLRPAIEEEDN